MLGEFGLTRSSRRRGAPRSSGRTRASGSGRRRPLKLTAEDLLRLKLIDEVVPERWGAPTWIPTRPASGSVKADPPRHRLRKIRPEKLSSAARRSTPRWPCSAKPDATDNRGPFQGHPQGVLLTWSGGRLGRRSASRSRSSRGNRARRPRTSPKGSPPIGERRDRCGSLLPPACAVRPGARRPTLAATNSPESTRCKAVLRRANPRDGHPPAHEGPPLSEKKTLRRQGESSGPYPLAS